MEAIAFFDSKSSSNSGKISGAVRFTQSNSGHHTRIQIELSGFEPNSIHGCHIHQSGDLSRGCDSTCAHYNPFGAMHGQAETTQLPDGSLQLSGYDRHVGDLVSNIVADINGSVNITFWDNLVELDGPYSVIGRAVVIHEDADDCGHYQGNDTVKIKQTTLSGNAGARIACAIIGRCCS
jgi:Cu-Zn family superoxide dismutase